MLATQKQTWDLERNFNFFKILTFLSCSLSISSISFLVYLCMVIALFLELGFHSKFFVRSRWGGGRSKFLLQSFGSLSSKSICHCGLSWGGLPLAPEAPTTYFESSTFAFNVYVWQLISKS